MSDESTKEVESVIQAEMERQDALAAESKCEVEVWLMINESGDYQAGMDEEQAADGFAINYGGDRRRTFRLWLTVPLPQVTEIRGELPEYESGAYCLEVKQP